MTDTTTDPADALEARVLAGDTTVTEEEAVGAYTEAAGRRWFAGLRQRRADQLAAEEAQREHDRRQAAALEAARANLARTAPARIADAYDEAARGIAALVDIVADRESTLLDLVAASGSDRVPGVAFSLGGRPTISLDGQSWRRLDLHDLLDAAIRQAGATDMATDGRWEVVDRRFREAASSLGRDPAVVQLGRSMRAT